MIRKFFKKLRLLLSLSHQISALVKEQSEQRTLIEKLNINLGLLLNQLAAKDEDNNPFDHEYSIFSEWGDDGIIQFLVNKLKIDQHVFVEFGVENYVESNTRFLLINNNWKGLIIDGSKKNIDYIKNDQHYWRYDLTAIDSFITRENINSIISGAGFGGEIGLLSIDIDGNDYWVWEKIDVVNPIIVIIEYNSVFGSERSITIPYKKDFYRTDAHHSNLYFGASLPAIVELSQKKGYSFIGCNKAGNNAYFLRKDKMGLIYSNTIEKGYIKSKTRESRDQKGQLNFISGENRLKEIKGLPVWNTKTEEMEVL